MLLQLLRQFGSEPKAQSPWSTGTFDGQHWLVCFKASDIFCLIKPGMRCWDGGGVHKFYCSQKKDLQINLRAERGGFSPISFTIIVRYSWAPAKLIIHPMNIAGIDDQVLLFRVKSEHSLPPGRTETSEALDKPPSCGEAWFKVKGWHPWAHSVLLLLFFYSTVIGELKAMTSIYFFNHSTIKTNII